MNLKHLLVFLAFSAASCTTKSDFTPYYQSENASGFDHKLDLRSNDTLKFPLDEKSSFESNSISYRKIND